MVSFLLNTAFFILFCSLLSTLFNPVYAVQVNQLYSTTVPVASQQKKDRSAGFDQAFQSVLVKASGQFNKVSRPGLLKSVLPAEPYVQTFSYRENPAYQHFLQQQLPPDSDFPGSGELNGPSALKGDEASQLINMPVPGDDLSLEINGPPPSPYLLDVSFAPSLVQEKMAQLDIPVWGSVRPSVLVWLVLEKQGERFLAGTSDESDLVEELMNISEERGVPVYLPVADLQELNAVSLDDIWGLFPESVASASERYQADAIVMMRAYQSDNQLWTGNWSLNLKRSLDVGSRYDVELTDLLASLVSDIASNLSARYAISNESGEQGSILNLEVSEINTFRDFIEIQRYLEALPPVGAVQMKSVKNGRVSFQVRLIASIVQFGEHVDLGGRMRKDPMPELVEETATTSTLEDRINQLSKSSFVPRDYYIWSPDRSWLSGEQ